jgi:hypothetical protein
MTVRNALWLRGAFNVLFALYLWLVPLGALQRGLGRGGLYFLGDGLLAVLLAVALYRDARGRWLVALAVADAIARIVAGALILANPDLDAFVIASALFFTAAITVCIALGMVGVLYAVLAARSGAAPSRGGRVRPWPALVASALTLLLGCGLIFGVPGTGDLRLLLAAYAFALGLTLLGATLPRLGTPAAS